MHTSSSTNDRIRIGSSPYLLVFVDRFRNDAVTSAAARQGNQLYSLMASAATSMMARVDRLDLVLSYLEELHHQSHHHHHLHGGGGGGSNMSTSTPSTPTTQSADSSPRGSRSASWRRACRPAKEVLEEAHAKGSLVDRIAFLEDRVLKVLLLQQVVYYFR